MRLKIIIDTDPGHDDAMAIMLVVKSELFDIHAITTVCGNSTIANTTRNARYILNLLDREDIPIFSGASKPLKRPLTKAVVHGVSGLAGIDPKNPANLTRNAVDKILSIVKKYPDEITIITLAPLTNIAQAMIKNPNIMKRVKEIIIMGGAIKVSGNKNRVAEFNIFVDPEAADIVFKFPIKRTIVPLDACNHVRLSLEDFKAIKNEKLKGELLKMIGPYIDNIAKDEGIRAALMYDPLTVFYKINPKAAKTSKYNVLVETKGELTRGMTVADLRMKPEVVKSNVTVVEYIDGNKFKDYFIRILSSS